MAVSDVFDTRYKLWSHVVVIFLVIIVIALSGAHMNLGIIYTRAEVMGIAMSAKTIVIILYQILSQHVQRFRRWESLTANMILNFLEILFWLVVFVLKIQGISRICLPVGCDLARAVAACAFFITLLSIHVAVISFLDRQYFKRNHKHRGAHTTTPYSSEY